MSTPTTRAKAETLIDRLVAAHLFDEAASMIRVLLADEVERYRRNKVLVEKNNELSSRLQACEKERDAYRAALLSDRGEEAANRIRDEDRAFCFAHQTYFDSDIGCAKCNVVERLDTFEICESCPLTKGHSGPHESVVDRMERILSDREKRPIFDEQLSEVAMNEETQRLLKEFSKRGPRTKEELDQGIMIFQQPDGTFAIMGQGKNVRVTLAELAEHGAQALLDRSSA